MDFNLFKNAVAKQFATMMKHDLFVVDIEGDALWETYIQSFPAGTNPIYRERTEHDCSCCKSFIRAVGRVVALIDGKMVRKHACIDGPEIDAHKIDWDKFLPRFNLFKPQELESKKRRGLA